MNKFFLITFISIITFTLPINTYAKSWDNSYYIWNFALISSSDKGLNKAPTEYFEDDLKFDKNIYKNINEGDVVWLKCKFVPQFCKEVLPQLKHPIVLLISDGDESFPSDCEKDFDVESLLNNKNIIHVFAQNNDYSGSSKKISHMPIGLDLHTISYKGSQGGWGEKGSPTEQEHQLNTVLANLKPTYMRKKRAFVDFHLADTMHADHQRYLQFGEDRKSIFERVVMTGLVDYGSWMRRSKLWAKKGEYAFSISPHGNGLDCHRTWEDLILGCIVIVKSSPLDPLYEGLPVVIIKDWSEITEKNLDCWLSQFGDAFTNPSYREKLTTNYWLSKIKTAVKNFKRN